MSLSGHLILSFVCVHSRPGLSVYVHNLPYNEPGFHWLSLCTWFPVIAATLGGFTICSLYMYAARHSPDLRYAVVANVLAICSIFVSVEWSFFLLRRIDALCLKVITFRRKAPFELTAAYADEKLLPPGISKAEWALDESLAHCVSLCDIGVSVAFGLICLNFLDSTKVCPNYCCYIQQSSSGPDARCWGVRYNWTHGTSKANRTNDQLTSVCSIFACAHVAPSIIAYSRKRVKNAHAVAEDLYSLKFQIVFP